jgi:hypothetical protein
MTAFQESAPFLRGREGELRVAALLQSRGWYILPSSDYSGPAGNHAPKIHGAQEGIVLPDLAIAKKGLLLLAEVKAKWEPTFTILTGTYDHGISRRLCRQYLRCQEEMGAHVWLFILEEKSQTLLFQSIDELRKSTNVSHIYEGDVMDKGGMVFWPRDVFQKIVIDAIPGLFDVSIPLAFEKPPQ